MPGSILIVEDDVDIRDALLSILADEGYPVVGAANGQEALEHLRAPGDRPALILLDLMMPVMNGWQFRSAQKEDPAIAEIPVVIISADASLRQRAATIDAIAYLKKPIELEVLLDTVAKYAA